MPHKVTRLRVPKTQTLPGLLGQLCLAKRNKAACGIPGMQLLALKARRGCRRGLSFPGRVPGQVPAPNLVLCFAEPRELQGIVLQGFCEGHLCLSDAGALSSVTWGGGWLLWVVPAGERCEEGGWLVHSKIGLDLGAAVGLESPPGADLVDIMNSPVFQWECGSGGKPGACWEALTRCPDFQSCTVMSRYRSTSNSTINLNF